MEHAAAELERIINGWGLTLSAVKTKLLVAGAPGTEEELRPLVLQGGEIECVGDFKYMYLGSVLEAKESIVKEAVERIAKASRAFGTLKEPPFLQNQEACVQSCCVGSAPVWVGDLDDQA